MKILPITKLVMDDICKNVNDVYQVAFYRIENFELEKKISLGIEKNNCNKVRIIELDWLEEQELLTLPDILILKETTILSEEEIKIFNDLNIKLYYIDEDIMINNILFNKTINEIERKIYKEKTLKYFQIERKVINSIEDKFVMSKEDKEQIENYIIENMLDLIKDKDEITYLHVKNVSDYVDIFVDGMPVDKKLSFDEIVFLKKACLVHDIGKLAIPNQILKKRSSLSNNEYHNIKKHVSDNAYFFDSKIMNSYKEIALSHHERYDGKGYPNGLKNIEIPYYARIISVLDAFEAMTGNRDYVKEEEKKNLYEVLNILINNSGTQFDPEIVKYFIHGIINNKEFQSRFKQKSEKTKKKTYKQNKV